MFRRFFLTAAAAVAVGLIAPATSQAAFASNFQMRIQRLDPTLGTVIGTLDLDTGVGTDAGDRTLTDNLTSADLNPAANHMLIAQTNAFGIPATGTDGLTVSVTSNRQDEVDHALLNEVNTTVTNNTGSIVRLRVTVTSAFQLPAGNPLNIVGSTVYNSVGTSGLSFYNDGAGGNPEGGFWVFHDTAATPFSQAATDFNVTTPTTSVQSGANSFARAGDYSVTLVMDFTLAAGGSVDGLTGTARIDAAPAPAGLILAATALPFVGLLRRRLRGAAPTV